VHTDAIGANVAETASKQSNVPNLLAKIQEHATPTNPKKGAIAGHCSKSILNYIRFYDKLVAVKRQLCLSRQFEMLK
jgi:hypothetical protein